jgi:hypothetical protein
VENAGRRVATVEEARELLGTPNAEVTRRGLLGGSGGDS